MRMTRLSDDTSDEDEHMRVRKEVPRTKIKHKTQIDNVHESVEASNTRGNSVSRSPGKKSPAKISHIKPRSPEKARHSTSLKESFIKSDKLYRKEKHFGSDIEDGPTCSKKAIKREIESPEIKDEDINDRAITKSDAAGNSSDTSDGEPPLSQFWLCQNKNAAPGSDEELSPQNSQDSVTKERGEPLRITNTKIVSTKYKIINKDDEFGVVEKFNSSINKTATPSREPSIGKTRTNNGTRSPNKLHSIKNSNTNDKILSTTRRKTKTQSDGEISDSNAWRSVPQKVKLENDIPEESVNLDEDDDITSHEKSADIKKEMTMSKTMRCDNTYGQELRDAKGKTVAKKRRLSVKAEPLDDDQSNTDEPKVKKRTRISKKTTVKTTSWKLKLDICDEDTTEDETENDSISNKTHSSEKLSHNMLSLAMPKASSAKKSNSNSTQLLLTTKTVASFMEPDENNAEKVRDSIADMNPNVPPRDRDKETSSLKAKTAIKRKSNNDGSPVRKNRKLSQSFMLDKLEDYPSSTPISLSTDRHSAPTDSFCDLQSTPSREVTNKKSIHENVVSHAETEPSNTWERTVLPRIRNSDAISDSDVNDELTKLNTTLNRSMTFMKSKENSKTSQKSRKSVSINTNHNVSHATVTDNVSQKGILKKTSSAASEDDNELTNSSQQDSQVSNEHLVVKPQIIQRPMNIPDFINQKNLTIDSTRANFRVEDISEEESIWVLKMPKLLDPRELKGQTIKLGGKNKLRFRDQVYETCNMNTVNLSCMFNTSSLEQPWKIVNIKADGFINIRQKLSKKMSIDISSGEKKTVPFPTQLKPRHPFFGADYEDKLTNPRRDTASKSAASETKLRPEAKKLVTKKSALREKRSRSTSPGSISSDSSASSEFEFGNAENKNRSSREELADDIQTATTDILSVRHVAEKPPNMVLKKDKSSKTQLQNASNSAIDKISKGKSKKKDELGKQSPRKSLNAKKNRWSVTNFALRRKKSV